MRSHKEAMLRRHKAVLAVCVLTLAGGAAFAESGFLADYSQLKPVTGPAGTDLVYVAPDGFTRIASYKSVLIDWPEVHFSADSEYRGMKPQDITEIATIMRATLKSRIEEGGRYTVVAKPDEDVLYVRAALTELYLKKKKRGALGYTPVGAVVKLGSDALKQTLEKLDIIEMALEAEFADSESGEVLAAVVIERGARKAQGQKEQRMDVAAFRATVHEYGDRLRCRLDNARLPETQWIDCTDPKARQLREDSGS
jgi:Protein of unknown function (DUF3313)